MKYFELDKSEEKMLEDFERGAFRRASHLAEAKKRYQSIVTAALKKAKNINIRLSEHDLLKLKARVAEEGMPYQTYLASLVHKHLKMR